MVLCFIVVQCCHGLNVTTTETTQLRSERFDLVAAASMQPPVMFLREIIVVPAALPGT
jgi:hypothetical protein